MDILLRTIALGAQQGVNCLLICQTDQWGRNLCIWRGNVRTYCTLGIICPSACSGVPTLTFVRIDRQQPFVVLQKCKSRANFRVIHSIMLGDSEKNKSFFLALLLHNNNNHLWKNLIHILHLAQ